MRLLRTLTFAIEWHHCTCWSTWPWHEFSRSAFFDVNISDTMRASIKCVLWLLQMLIFAIEWHDCECVLEVESDLKSIKTFRFHVADLQLRFTSQTCSYVPRRSFWILLQLITFHAGSFAHKWQWTRVFIHSLLSASVNDSAIIRIIASGNTRSFLSGNASHHGERFTKLIVYLQHITSERTNVGKIVIH